MPLGPESAAQRRAEREERLLAALGDTAARAYAAVSRSMAAFEAGMDLEGYWYLSILGVDPAHQGRRIGARLLQPVLDEADARGAHSFLTTFSPGNIRFYESLGFERAAEHAEPVTGASFSLLIRPAGVPE